MERPSSEASIFAEATQFEDTHFDTNDEIFREADVVSLKEAASSLNLSMSKLKRLIKGGKLPEAFKTRAPEGRIWVLPLEALPDIAAREHIDLNERDLNERDLSEAETFDIISVDDRGQVTIRPEEAQEVNPVSTEGAPSFAEALDLALLDRLLGVQEQAVLAVADAERAEADLEQLTNKQVAADAELEAERRRTAEAEERFHTEQLARVTAESRAKELEIQVRREEALAREERAAASYANMRSLRREREAALAAANLGWRGRRRYRRQISLDTPT